IGELAKYWYPDGIEIHSIDREQAADETERRLGEERIVLFEPAIRVGPFLVRIDILVKDGEHFELIEVKAKSYDPRDPGFLNKRDGSIASGMRPYLQDVAFQKWILQQRFPKAQIRTFL